MQLLAHIDQPVNWALRSQGLVIRGWCFSEDGEPILAVRLRLDRLILNGVTGLPRPDVKAALPAAPHDNTGFEIRGLLPPGHHSLRLESRLNDGTWVTFAAPTVSISRSWWPPWLSGSDLFFLLATQATYPPRPIGLEKFPVIKTKGTSLKLSIVTPSYQQARFLNQTMRSVLEQPQACCEYVVHDGGSTDGCADIIRQYAARLHSWTSTRDGGQADAIAKAFARTTGGADDIMAWINSDDFYLPGALSYVADYFSRHPAVDVIYGHRLLVDEDSQEISRWILPPHDEAVLRINDFVPQETLFWRRRVWDKVGGLDTSFSFAMDWDLLLRFQSVGANIVRVPYFLACFRLHTAQKTSARMHDLGQQEITRLRERVFRGHPPPENLDHNRHLRRYLRRSAYISFLWKLGLRAP